MQTLKTAVVVVLLLFVLYGGYIALNGPDTQLREDLAGLVGVDEVAADVSGPGPIAPPSISTGSTGGTSNNDPWSKFASTPGANFNTNAGPTTPGGPDGRFPPLQGNSPNLPELPSAFSNTTAGGSNATGNFPNASLPGLPKIPSIDTNGLDLNTPALSGFPDTDINRNNPFPKSGENKNNSSNVLDVPSLGNFNNPNDQRKELDSPDPSSLSPNIPTSKPGKSFENAKQLAMDQIESGNLKDALATLTVFYNAPELTSTQRADLVDMLDALAREVIFSRRHLMDVPYVIAVGETLDQVAKRWNVPTELIARINALDATSSPQASTKLKVVPGPFRAEVDLTRNELTLFVEDLYAGHFPVTFGSEPSPKSGIYEVAEKQRNRNYYTSNGMQIPAADERNPYGGFWIDLGQDVCIHGSPAVEGSGATAGCISLSPLDASDVFGMLGRGSQVTIRR